MAPSSSRVPVAADPTQTVSCLLAVMAVGAAQLSHAAFGMRPWLTVYLFVSGVADLPKFVSPEDKAGMRLKVGKAENKPPDLTLESSTDRPAGHPLDLAAAEQITLST